MKKISLTLPLVISAFLTNAQGNPEDYYYEIPDAPEEYTPGAVAARMVDGLGFRYYWGTEGLRPEDLRFRASDSARTINETIDHIHGLTQILLNAVNQRPHEAMDLKGLSYKEKRKMTLSNIREASEILKSAGAYLKKYDLIFSEESQFPFWNLLNGPIADAIHHNGQIITMRRTSGNPIHDKISVLRGKVYTD